jgi:hypothetical protein
VLIYEPTSGSPTRFFIDAETHAVLKVVVKLDVPQFGGEIEQTTTSLRLSRRRRRQAAFPAADHVIGSEFHDHLHDGGAQRADRSGALREAGSQVTGSDLCQEQRV